MNYIEDYCKVESLGIQEIDVYDIEVDTNHNFFANDILVHNSLYVDVQPLVDKFCNGKTEEQIVNFIDAVCKSKFKDMLTRTYQEFYDYTNAFENTINFKREAICSKGLWVAKKKYIVKVHDNEGVRYATPEIKTTGLQLIQSSTPAIVKKTLKECVAIIFNDNINSLRTHVDKVKVDFFNATVEDISAPRGVNEVLKYMGSGSTLYKKGAPIAIRAAILHNHYVKKLKLQQKYSTINNGDKVKFVFLKTQNPLAENVMAFAQDFPDEIVNRKYVDYPMQFEKVFLNPLNIMLNSIGWELEQKLKLDDFFC
jgi:DNA polymerase elongation subunit (family B)